MNKQREALEAAEDALASCYEVIEHSGKEVTQQTRALALVRAALAEPEQEPSNVPRQAPTSCVRQHGLKYDMPPLYMNASQLRQAVDFLGDDPDGDLELAFAMRDEGKNTDDEIIPAGLYVWLAEYPEEGALYLDGAALRAKNGL